MYKYHTDQRFVTHSPLCWFLLVLTCIHSLSGGLCGTVRLSRRNMRSLEVPFTSLAMFSMSGWRGLPDNPNTYTAEMEERYVQ